MGVLVRNGIRLCFDLVEGERPPVVLVHGWCCDRSFMDRQFAFLAARGHTVMAMDLRGHGASDKPEQAYTFEEFGDDVLWMCAELGLERPVIVGHSMGGIIAFDIAVRFPALPRAIAMIDSAAAMSDEARAGVARVVPLMEGPDRRAALRAMIDAALFISTDDPARRARILAVMETAPRCLLVSGAEALRDYDPTPAKGRLSAPSLFIAADEPTPRSDLAHMAELVPQLQVGRTVGAGHFCHMEVPDQVNAMLDRFLALAVDERQRT